MPFNFKSTSRNEHSRRTRAGQARARAEGKTWWATDPDQQALMVARATVANRHKADQRALAFLAQVAELRVRGISTTRGIERELNARGLKTPSGGRWTRLIIRTMLQRAERLLIAKATALIE